MTYTDGDGRYLGISAKAANAGRLDGLAKSTAASANTIVQRDGAADITARLFRSNYQNESRMTGAVAFRVNTSDNYVRWCSSQSAFRAWLSTYSKAESDGRYLGKTTKAADSDKLDGIDSRGFAQISNGLNTGDGTWTTAQFLAWLTAGGYFRGYFVFKPSWWYAGNRILTDTGFGNFELAGSVIEVIGTSATNCTIRIQVANAQGGDTLVYNHQGNTYSPGWTKVYNSRNKPTATDVGLGNVPNWGATGSVTNSSNATFATALGVKTAMDRANAAYSLASGRMADGGTYGTVYMNNWFRANGNTGLYFQAHGGGWHMTDSTWIRAYGNKRVYVSQAATDALMVGGGIRIAGLGLNYAGRGVTGVYDSHRFQGVFSMGAAYQLPTNGLASSTTANAGNLYGIAWTHSNNTNTNGRKISGHHACFMSNGVTKSAVGDHIWTAGHVYASNLNARAEVYVQNWTRFRASGGLYWQTGRGAGYHIYPVDTRHMVVRSGDSGQGRLRFTNANETRRCELYWGSTGMGFADSQGRVVMTLAQDRNVQCWSSFTAVANVTAYSDRRIKKNIERIVDPLDKVDALNGCTFTRRDQKGRVRQVGLIAQEVRKVLPEAVMENDIDTSNSPELKRLIPDGKLLTVAYGNLAGLFVEAIKSLRKIVNRNSDRIEQLEAQNEALLARLAKLEERHG